MALVKWAGVASVLAIAFIALFYSTTLGNLENQEQVCTTVTQTETITVTVTQILTTYITPQPDKSNYVNIIHSLGKCGLQDKPQLVIVDKKPVNNGEQYVVLLSYSEQTNVPCYRHVIDSVYVLKRYPPIIEINLRLESTSEICIQCIGVVETLIEVGSPDNPIPAGAEIRVNGLAVVV